MTNPPGAAYRNEMDVVRTSVSDVVEDVFGSLNRIADAATALWERRADSGSDVRAGDLADLRAAILPELSGRAVPLHGAGLVLAHNALADRSWHLEWWRSTGRTGSAPHKERFDLNPNSDYYYDYSTSEWFVVPRERGTRWVAGPYLDYAGVDLYICTFAVPVRSAAGEFLGIAGADVTLAQLDTTLMRALRAGGRPLALVNAEGRVIVGNHADYVTGSRLKRAAIATGEPVPGTQWTLVELSGQVGRNVQ